MITFKNGLIISGNPKITKTNFGVLITNDFGLNLQLSNNIWQSINL